jgi:polar amino acid transport system substrate-binding protein
MVSLTHYEADSSLKGLSMRHLTKLIFVAATIALSAVSPALADLRIGVAAEPYAPFTSKDASGKWVGWEIDMVDALCAEIKEKCTIVETAWDGIIPALTAKKIDVILASMSKTAKRKEVINFSDTYYMTAVMMAGPKDGDKDISPEHMKGKTIGTQVSSIQAAYLDKYYAKTSTIKTYQTLDDANADLAAGRIDGVLANGLALEAFVASEQGACCEVKDAVIYDKDVLGEGIGAGMRKEDTELAAKINAGLAALSKAGTFETISAKYKLTGKLITPKG